MIPEHWTRAIENKSPTKRNDTGNKLQADSDEILMAYVKIQKNPQALKT